MAGTLKKAIFPLAAGAVLILVAIVSGATVAGQNSVLDAQKAELAEVTAAADEARESVEQVQTAATFELSGASEARVADDTEIIEDLAERVLTWDSHASYVEARDSTMRAYGLAEDAPFLQSFLPPAPVSRDAQGNEYPYIDAAKLNSRVGFTTVKLLSVDALEYSYMALVDVESKSSDRLGTASNVATIFVTVHGDGTVHDLAGFASTTPPTSTR